jgi:RHS repeat-associated protein
MTYLHEPFGTALVAEGSVPDAFHYRGLYTDPATGLVCFAMRWYDPEVGAFIAPDPDAGDAMNPMTLNRYAYLGGDPVNRIDPLGAQAVEGMGRLGDCLQQTCNLFQRGKIEAVFGTGKTLQGYSYAGAVDKGGWAYDIWVKRVPGSDRFLTLVRDLNQRAEGLGQRATLYGNMVLDPDGPMHAGRPPAFRPTTSGAAPASNARPSLTLNSGVGDALNSLKQGVQVYGKEIAGTVATLGGISGTLGTSLSALWALPGSAAIIAAAFTVAAVVGLGVGSAINMIPGVAETTQSIFSNLLGYQTDQTLANLEAKAEQEGPAARARAEKKIAENLAKDTMPPPPEPGVASGTTTIGEPPRRDRDRPHVDSDAQAPPDTGAPPDAAGEVDDGSDDTAVPTDTDILKLVTARSIKVPFTNTQDISSDKVKEVLTCTWTLTFWNVGALAQGLGAATLGGFCISSRDGSRTNFSQTGTFSGGPDGILTFPSYSGDGGSYSLQVRGGKTVSLPEATEVGEVPLPADAFADWPKNLRR